jgi:hypothetical protein
LRIKYASLSIMTYRIALFFVLICNLSFSQISVRNSAYIFINDEVFYVEDDINLNEASSTIYLRNESQLIQGDGTTGNSGIGELSVYQDGNVSEFEYGYWCSPIGSKTISNSNNLFGITLINDAIGLTTATPAGTTHSTNYNGTSAPLNIEPYWIWKFIASNDYSEWIHVQSATTIEPGEGFTMKGTTGSSSNQLFDFRGKPNNGTISVNVLNNQFTLTGNPYPSTMDTLAYIHDTENSSVINGTLYFWEQDPNVNSHNITEYSGGYASYTINDTGTLETYVPATFKTYNSVGVVNIVGSISSTGKRPRRYLPIGQGFMVEGTADGTVKAKNSHRAFKKESIPNDSTQFFKSTNKKENITNTQNNDNEFSKVPTDYKRFRLNIDFNNTYTRQLVETFHATATNGFDYGMESKINIADVLNSDAYLGNEGDLYIAEALTYNEALKIPLNINLAQDGFVNIKITDIQNFDSNQSIFVHDIDNDRYVNLNEEDFNVHLSTGDYNNRFELTFTKNNSLSIVEKDINSLKIFQNNELSNLTIYNPKLLNVKSFHLYDISGKRVFIKNRLPKKQEHTISTKKLSEGIYVVKIAFDNNAVFSKKVVITN